MRSAAAGIIHHWTEAALGFFYPNICQICRQHRAGAADGYVCERCWSAPGAISFIQPPFCDRCGLPFEGDITVPFECSNCVGQDLHFRYARAAVEARGLALEVIHRYKYHRALWFEPFLADLLTRSAAVELSPKDWDLIVPVPLHPVKRREREFNQAERLSRCLSEATGIPMETNLLRRLMPTRTQTRLSRGERALNVADAFGLSRGATMPANARIVLVDDVLTTGATTNACAKVLSCNGSSDLCVWTVARGL
ncbi:MAG: ComF family protein [Verrucomicrobiota bacterium]